MSLTLGPFSSTGQFSMRGSDQFPDPFMDMASTYMPTSPSDVLRWVEFLWLKMGLYREAMRRVRSYFVTDIEIIDQEASREEKQKYLEFLTQTLDVYNVLSLAADDYLCYGNSFLHLHAEFRRSLGCKACRGFEAPIERVYNDPSFNFAFQSYEFVATCPKCGVRGEWSHNDRRSPSDPILAVRRSPHEMEILYDPFTHKTSYVWKIPEDYRREFARSRPPLIYLENVRWEVLQAIKTNQYFRYDDDAIYHMKDETLAGVRNRGWGISRLLSNFGQAWYVQVLHRYNEAIALDYVVPFRLITPAPTRGGDGVSADPAVVSDLGNFSSRVLAMLGKHRQDPAGWNVLPFPVQYQSLGGEANALAPKDLLDQGIDNLLAAAGVPVDLYRGTLTTQAAPTSLRIFETNWTPLTHNLNGLLRFIGSKVSRLMAWEPVTARLTRTTMADNVERQANILQMMMSRQVSQSTGMQQVGLKFEEEQRRLIEEDQFVQEETAKAQEEQAGKDQMSQAVQGAGQGAAPGGAPAAGGGGGGAPPGPNDKISLQELAGQAQEIAQELAAMPESQKDSELIALRKANPNLAAIVKDQLAQNKQQTNQAGGEQLRAQMFGKQGSAFGADHARYADLRRFVQEVA